MVFEDFIVLVNKIIIVLKAKLIKFFKNQVCIAKDNIENSVLKCI